MRAVQRPAEEPDNQTQPRGVMVTNPPDRGARRTGHGGVVWQSVPPATTSRGTVRLRSTAAPMSSGTAMKSPIVATTDPRPFDACEDIPFDVVQRLGLSTPRPSMKRLRCPRVQELSPYYV